METRQERWTTTDYGSNWIFTSAGTKDANYANSSRPGESINTAARAEDQSLFTAMTGWIETKRRSDDMPILKVSLGIGFANAKHIEEIEIDDEEWSECETDEERENLIDQYAQEWAWNYIDIGAQIVE